MKYPWIVGLLAVTNLLAADQTKEQKRTIERLKDAASVLNEVMSAPDKGIPEDLLEKARCIVIVPSLKKGAFVVGAEYGKGFMSCRHTSHRGWSAPGAVNVEGGSFGFQIGGSETDIVMLVMNDRGADHLLSSKFTLGGEASVAGGPVGRTANADTDATMTAEILSWSRARGVFAGVSLQGATLRENRDDNAAIYGSRLTNREIVEQWHAPPEGSRPLLDALNRYSPERAAKR